MALVIVAILLFSYLLIATENITNFNKSAVAMFAGTLGWVLYICYGADFVYSQHLTEYKDFLNGAVTTSVSVKEYIASNIFLKYVGKAAEIVLFLIATMTIVEILNNNGCFDFITQLLKTRNSKKLLWMLSIITFLLSANLDNLTTTVMMLVVVHKIIPNRRLRMIYGSVIVVAANSGGALTVIGEPAGIVLWTEGAVTPTSFSMSMLLPCVIAWVVPTWWLGRSLPERVQTEWITMPYRGDDTNLNIWQRFTMLFLGIGGLWFIPTFHNITKLSPFLGALCVLSVLWVVNEIFNRKLMNADQMIQRRMPRVLQYGVIQMILFVLGIILALGVVRETGATELFADYLGLNSQNVWIVGVVTGLCSSVLDNFATVMSLFSLYSVSNISNNVQPFDLNGIYWTVIAYSSAVGGSILSIGSMSGLALMKMERVHLGWYFRNVGYKVMICWFFGLISMWIVYNI